MSGIRTLRALKPLRTISGVPGLRVLVTTIIDSMPFVGNACLILVWLFFVFGVVGIDMFAGELTHRCFTHGGEVLIREEANLPCDPGGTVGSAASASSAWTRDSRRTGGTPVSITSSGRRSSCFRRSRCGAGAT